MPLHAHLLDLLTCPRCKQRVVYFPRGEADASEAEAFLLCPGSALRFAIAGDIPNMIADEATALDPPEVARLVARARALGLPHA